MHEYGEGENPLTESYHAVTNEVDLPTWVDCGNLLLEYFGAVYWAARCWDSGDEDFIAVLL